MGILMAVGTLWIESYYQSIDLVLAATMGMVVFSLLNVAIGLGARSEFGSAFTRDILSDRRQLMLYGIAIGLTYAGSQFGFLQRLLGTTSLTLQQWLICIAVALILLVIDEIVKTFMRRRGGASAPAQPAIEVQTSNQPTTA
jgi:Ca2+-transporting ATPase